MLLNKHLIKTKVMVLIGSLEISHKAPSHVLN